MKYIQYNEEQLLVWKQEMCLNVDRNRENVNEVTTLYPEPEQFFLKWDSVTLLSSSNNTTRDVTTGKGKSLHLSWRHFLSSPPRSSVELCFSPLRIARYSSLLTYQQNSKCIAPVSCGRLRQQRMWLIWLTVIHLVLQYVRLLSLVTVWWKLT